MAPAEFLEPFVFLKYKGEIEFTFEVNSDFRKTYKYLKFVIEQC